MSEPVNPNRRIVTVWSDLASPTAALALHTLHRRAHDRRIPLLVDHRCYPRELLERSPTRKDVVDGEVAAIARAHPELGWRPWPGPDHAYPVTMLLAMEAVQAAKSPEHGGLLGSDQLDTELRRAFLVDGRCISLYPVIAEVAHRCPLLDADSLLDALAHGAGRDRVLTQWCTAAGRRISGSPHLFTVDGFDAFSPGDAVHWPAEPGRGVPHVECRGDGWADDLLDTL